MSRPMTSAERQRFQSWFPALDVGKSIVTGEASTIYNCIAWTVGLADRWIWPGGSIADFDTFYQGFGLLRTGDGPIAAWGHSLSNMTHGSISGEDHGPRWESKCGADLRIQHGLTELVGSTYGRVVAFYHPSRSVDPVYAAILEDAMETQIVALTSAQKQLLRGQVNRIPARVRRAFEVAFEAWKKSWFQGGLAINSDPHARTIGQKFDRLISLGSEIIPLVVEKLTDPDNFLALQLYDAIQPNERLLVQFGPGDERILEGEQGRARRVVQAWFANQ